MAWFSKQKKMKTKESTPAAPPPPAAKGEGIWYKCDACDEVVARAEWEKNWNVCPSCGQHDALPDPAPARARARPRDASRSSTPSSSPQDPLGFSDSKKYRDRLRVDLQGDRAARRVRLRRRAPSTGSPVSVGCFAFEFMGGSMGSVVGEKVTRVFDRAYERRIPAIVFSSTGGARMQEGIFSLMQMAKTSAALAPLPRRAQAVRLGDAPPDDRRRRRELRVARRRHHRRAEGAHRLRRPARHRADHPPEAAARASSAASSCSSTG